MIRVKWSIFAICVVCLSNHLYGQEEQLKTKTLSDVEVVLPNPTDLQPEWIAHFEVDQETLEKRIQEVKSLLDTLQAQLELSEEKQEAETRIKEFQSHLESLLLLKKQVVEQPSLAWLPKTSYSLDAYLEISDKIRDLNLDINFKNTDQQRFGYTASDVRQNLNNAFAHYLTLEKNSKEKFLKGLEVMSLGARLLYLEAEIEIANTLIEIDKKFIERYKSEQDHIDQNLEFDVDPTAVAAEREKMTSELVAIHNELLGLEAQSIKTLAEKNGVEPSRLINQKLTNFLIKEALIKAKLSLIETKSILYKSLHEPEEITYGKDIEPIKTFRNNTQKQLTSWKKIVSSEIDQLSQSMVKVNGKEIDKGEMSTYEESLKISLSNKAFLDALSRELYHIKVVLGLIDQQILERQTVFDQIFYNLQNFWHWFTESFGVWFYYSLFDIGGVPITLAGLFKAVLIVLVAVWLSNFIGRALKQLAKGKGKVVEPTLYTFRRIIHYLILLVGILFALASLGLTMRNMAIVLGAVGIGIGFGLQNIVNNFLCGLAILFERNVKIGDYVELESGFLGRITEVNVQNTTLHTFDGVDVLVPNSSLIASNVVNWTKKDPYQRLHIPFGVAYGTDQTKVSEVVFNAALKIPYTMRESHGVKDPEVWLVEFGDSSLNFELVVWVNIFKSRGRRAMNAAYLSEIELALKEHNIHIPFPQRDLHLKTLPDEGFQIAKK